MKCNEMMERAWKAKAPAGSHVLVDLQMEINGPDGTHLVRGFYAGEDTYKVRFLPEKAGKYYYVVSGLIVEEGTFEVQEADERHHGVVRADGVHLRHQDGTFFTGFGTTVYALANQDDTLMDETIESLAKAPFNKVRMCVFPKHYNYNMNEPPFFAFARKDNTWDVHHPCFAFWDRFERRMEQLFELGIQVDLILFHPYDRWGFAAMKQSDNLVYLEYVIRRFAAYPDIWWSLANEYDLCFDKKEQDWEEFGEKLAKEDPYHHLIGNHNCFAVYDAEKNFISHVSIQNRVLSRVSQLQEAYGKPVCYDECCYEGNLADTWGNIGPKEMTRRFWQITTTGGHCTHGETYLDPEKAYDPVAVVWWARGGSLTGESVERIAYLRALVEEMGGPIDNLPIGLTKLVTGGVEAAPEHMKGFVQAYWNMDEVERTRHYDSEYEYAGHVGDDILLYYLDITCPARKVLELPEGRSYQIDLIDTWNMTRTTVAEHAIGKGVNNEYEVYLPGREYMAILCIADKE